MSNSTQHKLSAILEVTYGVTPAVTPAFTIVPHTGTTLALSKGIIESGIINLNRQVTDVRHGNRQIGGEIATELIYGDFDTFLEALLCGTWTPRIAAYTAGTISAAAADNSINDSAGAFPVFTVGENINIAGFTGTVGNNSNAVVVSRTANKIVVSGVVLVNDAAGEAVTLTSLIQSLAPGVTQRSFSILRQFTDITGTGTNYPFQLFKGCMFNTLALTLAPESLVKLVFGLFGKEYTNANTAPAGATYTAASGRKPYDSFTGTITVDGVAVASVTELSINAENGIEPRFVVFSDKTNAPKLGRTRITGSLTLYFDNSDMLVAFNGAVKKNLVFSLMDLLGNTYIFNLPSILSTGGQTDVEGESDVTISFPFSAIYEVGAAAPDALLITRDPA